MGMLIFHYLSQQFLVNGDIWIFSGKSRVSLKGNEKYHKLYLYDKSYSASPLSCTHLAGEELQYQVTFSLNFRRTGSRLQLKPGVISHNWDLLQEWSQQANSADVLSGKSFTLYPARESICVDLSGRVWASYKWDLLLTFKGMLMHPRKSSAFSSEPDDADPLARTDFAICLKYLGVQGKSWHRLNSCSGVLWEWQRCPEFIFRPLAQVYRI